MLISYTIRSKNKFGLAKHLLKMIHNKFLGCKEYFTNQSRHNIFEVKHSTVNKLCVCPQFYLLLSIFLVIIREYTFFKENKIKCGGNEFIMITYSRNKGHPHGALLVLG